MNVLEIISFCFIITYCVVFGTLTFGFILKKKRNKKPYFKPVLISVIIPFRNEEKNINNLIKSFIDLNYNLNIVEFIFIDDHSTDRGYELLSSELKKTKLIYKIIKQSEARSGKKQAIETGINRAKNELIITTDADSVPSRNWLLEFAVSFQSGETFIIGPVINSSSSKFLNQLQSIEALMLSGVTIGSASLNKAIICSGANLGFSKRLFEEIKPYEDNLHLSSGDDLFFLDKVLAAKKQISCLKSREALVFTKSHDSYQHTIYQAIRWASKNKALKSKKNLYLSILVFGTNVLLLINLITLGFGDKFSLFYVSLKFSIDLIFLIVIAKKYKQKKLILFAPFIYMLYPIHLLIIFVLSFFLSVKWKGRVISENGKKK
jgi:cellulose synthase/poly-beta-1,6-N-acetylglucosamine synthase-like glycosyltransferase